jgi:hypothetical protein
MSDELPVKKKNIYEKFDRQLKEVVLNYEHATVLKYLKDIACNFSFKKKIFFYVYLI